MPQREQELYEAVWKPKLERERKEGAYRGGSVRIDLAIRELPRGERLLDVGCGSGVFGSLILAEGRYLEVHGLELSREAAAKACERGLQALAFDLNGGTFPYPDAHFGAVTCLAVIEHVLDPRALVKEMARVLRPGGVLLLDTPNIRYAKHLWRLLVARRFPVTSGDDQDRRLAYDGGHLHYFTHRDVDDLLVERGLKPERHPCALPPRLRTGVVGRLAALLCRIPGLGALLGAEVFVVARRG